VIRTPTWAVGLRQNSAHRPSETKGTRRDRKASRITGEQILSSTDAFIRTEYCAELGLNSAHVNPRGTGGSNPSLSATESFSLYSLAAIYRNLRFCGQFRAALGTGERCKSSLPPICPDRLCGDQHSVPGQRILRRVCVQLCAQEAFLPSRFGVKSQRYSGDAEQGERGSFLVRATQVVVIAVDSAD